MKARRDNLQTVAETKTKLTTEIRILQKSIDNLLCQTCAQAIPDEKIQTIRHRIATLQAEEELNVYDPEEIRKLTNKIDKLSTIRSQGRGAVCER